MMKDPYYDDIKLEQLALYHFYFTKVMEALDIANNTAWANTKPYDRKRLASDDDLMQEIIVGEAGGSGLSASHLQIMVNQFVFADVRLRDLHKGEWVTRVVHRKEVDFFPDGWSMRRVLEKLNQST